MYGAAPEAPNQEKGSQRITEYRKHRINDQIRVPQVRLIDADGEQLGVVPTEAARARALELELDLDLDPDLDPDLDLNLGLDLDLSIGILRHNG